jgi:hypothetical protein
MKMVVKLAVLFATLLLLSGIAFAFIGNCACYKFTFTDLVDPARSATGYVEICLDYENNTGTYGECDISLFPGLITQGLIGAPCACVQFFKFHGSDNNVITGDYQCRFGDESKGTAWGHITDESNCTPP